MKTVFSNQNAESRVQKEAALSEELLTAYAALNSKHKIEWEVLHGIPYLNGFIGFKESESAKTEALVKEGKIKPYYLKDEGEVFLIADAIDLINRDPEVRRVSLGSYNHVNHSPEEQVIFTRRYWYPDHMLVKYYFRKETFYAILPVSLWGKPVKTGNALIRIINRNIRAQRHGR